MSLFSTVFKVKVNIHPQVAHSMKFDKMTAVAEVETLRFSLTLALNHNFKNLLNKDLNLIVLQHSH